MKVKVMRELGMEYMKDPPQEKNKQSGRPEKSSIEKLIATLKNEIVKTLMRAGEEKHGHRIIVRRKEASVGKYKREKGVYKQEYCAYYGTKLRNNYSKKAVADTEEVARLKSIISGLKRCLDEVNKVFFCKFFQMILTHIFYQFRNYEGNSMKTEVNNITKIR